MFAKFNFYGSKSVVYINPLHVQSVWRGCSYIDNGFFKPTQEIHFTKIKTCDDEFRVEGTLQEVVEKLEAVAKKATTQEVAAIQGKDFAAERAAAADD